MNKCGVYVITSPSGKGYVGSSSRLSKRRTRHFYDLRNGIHHCVGLQSAWDKYGDRLNFTIIEYCDADQLTVREQFWLDNSLFIGLYNSNLDASNCGPITDDCKTAISNKLKGRKFSEQHKANMRKPKSPAHAAAISAGKRGKVPRYTADSLAKRRASVSVSVKRSWEARRVANHMAKINWICPI